MFARLTRNEAGAAVIELALITPVLVLLIIGIVDISSALNRKVALEQGVQRAIEKIMQSTANNTEQDTLRTELICQINGINDDGSCKAGAITPRDVAITYRLECNAGSGAASNQTSADLSAFDALDCGAGATREARYIEAKVTDKYAPMFPIHFSALDSDGTFHISATGSVRIQ